MGGRLALRAAGAALTSPLMSPLISPILPDDRGAPRLPPAVVGSISHKEDLAVGLVSTDLGWRVGIDLEDPRALRRDISSRVLTAAEQAALAPLDEPTRRAETMARFAIKEAIYKAIDPYLRRYVGFTDVELDFDGATVVVRSSFPLAIDANWRAHDGFWLATARALPRLGQNRGRHAARRAEPHDLRIERRGHHQHAGK